MKARTLIEEISVEADLINKLKPISDKDIFEFMDSLRGGTYFNMGMYSPITVSRAYKKTIRIYKVVTMTAIVSGVSYENIGTTKDFRNRTEIEPGKAWYDHVPGFENKIGAKKSDPNSKYVLWDVKKCSGTCVYYYVVDIATGMVTPISRDQILDSEYLTDSEKKRLMPTKVEGYDKTTGTMIENQTIWRTTAFDHVFWLSQEGKSTREYGVKFMENMDLREAAGFDLFADGNANAKADLDTILSGEYYESLEAETRTECSDGKTKLTEDTTKQLYIATDLSGGDLLGAVWAVDEYEAYNFFTNDEPMIQDQNNDLYVELLDDSDYSLDDIAAVYPDVVSMKELGKKEGGYYNEYLLTDSLNSSEKQPITESYRRTVDRGNSLVDNELFVDFT